MVIIPELVPSILLAMPYVVTLVALHFLLFRPFHDYMEARDGVSSKALGEASELREATADKLKQLEDQLAEARKNVTAIRKEARGVAQGEEAEILAAARVKAEAKIAEAVERIQAEQKNASITLRGTAKVLSGDIARQVLGRAN